MNNPERKFSEAMAGGEMSAPPELQRRSSSGRRLHLHGIRVCTNVNDEEIGALFCEMRRALNVPLETIAQRLNAPLDVLQALEAGNVSRIDDWSTASRIVTGYAGLLKLDANPILRRIAIHMAPTAQRRSDLESGATTDNRQPEMQGQTATPRQPVRQPDQGTNGAGALDETQRRDIAHKTGPGENFGVPARTDKERRSEPRNGQPERRTLHAAIQAGYAKEVTGQIEERLTQSANGVAGSGQPVNGDRSPVSSASAQIPRQGVQMPRANTIKTGHVPGRDQLFDIRPAVGTREGQRAQPVQDAGFVSQPDEREWGDKKRKTGTGKAVRWSFIVLFLASTAYLAYAFVERPAMVRAAIGQFPDPVPEYYDRARASVLNSFNSPKQGREQ